MKPLLRNLENYKHHPFESMELPIVEFISSELNKLSDKALAKDAFIFMRIIECILQLIRRKLRSTLDFRTQLDEINIVVEGAIWSDQFIEVDSSRRSRYSRVWRLIKSMIVASRPELSSNPRVEPARMKLAERRQAITKFENMDKCPEALWYWSSWPVVNQTGKLSYLRLGRLYKSFGYEFSKRFYETYKSIVINQRAITIHGAHSLIEYLAENANTYNEQNLQDPKKSKQFLMSFRSHYFTKCYENGNGSKLKTISNTWLYSIDPFAKRLIKSGLLAAPYKGMPVGTPTFNGTHTPNQITRDDGREENIKLTFPIPLEVTDDEAIKLIFGQVQHDLELVKRWAKVKIDCVTRKQEKLTQQYARVSLAEELQAFDNAKSLEAHCFETYKRIGFATHHDLRLAKFYDAPLKQVAEILPLPTTNNIVPFAYFLIAHHSEITPDFLTECNLYDKMGMVSGLEHTDAGWYLVGNKYRKGAEFAQQKILLNEQTYRAVTTLIALTEPVREYLKKKNNPLSRKLFISTSGGFQKPKGPTTLTVSTLLRQKMVDDLKDLGASQDHAQTLSQYCTLTAVRALGGVAKYIETESLIEASRALGHTRFDYKLLKRYIPKPLITFFNDRWIRVFQQGLILEAMEGSAYALAATDFKTKKEMHQFLSKHALKVRKTTIDNSKTEVADAQKEVIFCIDEVVLNSMLKIARASDADQLTASDRYWSKIAKHLITHIESEECARPDFQYMLGNIKAKAA
ncbi:hypothetical protein [Pseudomonas sp. TWRC1-2]|uniref:hypothetical protein n=1 Tax=Pseudomonas sp. TWRC1-2 TaxID=2804628 RepID=UPI003CFBB613